MPQDIFVINDTISRNITLKEIENSDKKIKVKFEKVGLDSLLKLYHWYWYRGRRNWKNFSGGQKQRRTESIYHDKEIIILDEVTSSLELIYKKILNH